VKSTSNPNANPKSNAKYYQHTRPQRAAARYALAELTRSLALVDITLPSAGLDQPSLLTGTVLVQLGNARPDVVLRLAEVVRKGAA
jgi:hypothetical protein